MAISTVVFCDYKSLLRISGMMRNLRLLITTENIRPKNQSAVALDTKPLIQAKILLIYSKSL
jgi:hypothetical protein